MRPTTTIKQGVPFHVGSRPPKLVNIDFTPGNISHPAFTDRGPQSLHAYVNELAKAFFSESTVESYTSKLHKFAEFCRQHGLLVELGITLPGRPPVLTLPPITPVLMCFFIAWLRRIGHSTYDSIMAYVTAIAAWCKANGRPNPRDDPITNIPDHRFFCVCRGLKREMGAPPPRRYPVTLWHLDALITAAEAVLPRIQQVNFIAAVLLAFTGLLRVSEFTVKGVFRPPIHAMRNDVVFVPDRVNPTAVQFTIKVSKTDQFRESVTITIQRSDHSRRCPVRALMRLFEVDTQPLASPLFNFARDGVTRNSTRQQFALLCNNLFTYAGINSMYLKTHSFRQGGATALLEAGAPRHIIKIAGRWRSDSWMAYAFSDQSTLAEWSRAMTAAPAVPVDYNINPPVRVMDY